VHVILSTVPCPRIEDLLLGEGEEQQREREEVQQRVEAYINAYYSNLNRKKKSKRWRAVNKKKQ
jgi:hypothetical protein